VGSGTAADVSHLVADLERQLAVLERPRDPHLRHDGPVTQFTSEGDVWGAAGHSTGAPVGLRDDILRSVLGLDKGRETAVDHSPASADAFAPPHMGKTRFFSQVRMACVSLRKHVEAIVAEASVAGGNHTPQLDAVFETAVDALTDQLYGAFQHAGSKHVMAGRCSLNPVGTVLKAPGYSLKPTYDDWFINLLSNSTCAATSRRRASARYCARTMRRRPRQGVPLLTST
jgi:hypothetical protein